MSIIARDFCAVGLVRLFYSHLLRLRPLGVRVGLSWLNHFRAWRLECDNVATGVCAEASAVSYEGSAPDRMRHPVWIVNEARGAETPVPV